MIKQKDIVEIIKSVNPDVKIDQPRVSRILRGDIKIPFPVAIVLAQLFPKKTIPEWKKATGDEFKQAFSSEKICTL